MAKSVEFYFDFGSPTCYLACTQLPGIAKRAGAVIDWKPILLGGIHKATGNTSPIAVPAKAAWMMKDLQRCARRYGVPFQLNPHFPLNTLQLMRGAIAYQMEGAFHEYVDTIFREFWVTPKNLNDESVLAAVLGAGGFDPQEFIVRITDQAVKDRLKAETEAAVKRGVFGAPTYFIDGEMLFGQDRLHFVAEMLGVEFPL